MRDEEPVVRTRALRSTVPRRVAHDARATHDVKEAALDRLDLVEALLGDFGASESRKLKRSRVVDAPLNNSLRDHIVDLLAVSNATRISVLQYPLALLHLFFFFC